MTPADLLALAAEIETDTRIAPLARLITCAVLEGRAARMKVTRKGTGMGTMSPIDDPARGILIGNESGPTSAQTLTGPGPIPDLAGEDVAP